MFGERSLYKLSQHAFGQRPGEFCVSYLSTPVARGHAFSQIHEANSVYTENRCKQYRVSDVEDVSWEAISKYMAHVRQKIRNSVSKNNTKIVFVSLPRTYPMLNATNECSW